MIMILLKIKKQRCQYIKSNDNYKNNNCYCGGNGGIDKLFYQIYGEMLQLEIKYYIMLVQFQNHYAKVGLVIMNILTNLKTLDININSDIPEHTLPPSLNIH